MLPKGHVFTTHYNLSKFRNFSIYFGQGHRVILIKVPMEMYQFTKSKIISLKRSFFCQNYSQCIQIVRQ